jgi:hypothetical protein
MFSRCGGRREKTDIVSGLGLPMISVAEKVHNVEPL